MSSNSIVRRARQGLTYYDGLSERFQKTFKTDISREAAIELVQNRPEEPPFPTLVVLMNAIFDVLSIAASFLSLTGFGTVVYWVFKILTWVVNFFWFFGKESGAIGRLTQKIILRRILLWLVLYTVTDGVPFNDLITANTFLILSVHYHHKAVVKAFWFILDEIERLIPGEIGRMNTELDSHITRRARHSP